MQDAPINALLSGLQEQILRTLRENPKASYESLMTELGVDQTTIMRNIQKMKDPGILRRLGSKKLVMGKFYDLLGNRLLGLG